MPPKHANAKTTPDAPRDRIVLPDAPDPPLTGSLIYRRCPLCGREASTSDTEVTAPIRAEALDDVERFDYWRGFRSRSCFFDYARCFDCDLLFCPTYFSQPALDGLYASMSDNTAGADEHVLSDTQAGYINFLATHRPLEGTYLEIGPDIGLATSAAVSVGDINRTVLIEPNGDVHDQLRIAGGESTTLIASSLEELHDPAQADTAVLIHVLDHLIDPLGYLSQLRRHLNPGALVLVVVHNRQSLLRTALGVRWPPFCLQHPQLFSPATLEATLRQAGFTPLDWQSTVNVFPLRHAVKTASALLGVDGRWTDHVPDRKVHLRLGNMMEVARA